MVHSKNKILLLVEGNKTEPNLMKRYAKLLENEFKLEIISFETNIYVLYQNIRLLNENFDMDSTSTIEVLKSILKERMLKLINNQNLEKLETIKQQIKLLDDNYPYIYLLFDFEFQDNHYGFEEKKKVFIALKKYFNDETENGLLLISYPMIESFRDFNKKPLNDDYYERIIELEKINLYKSVVGKRGYNINLSKYTLTDFEKITLQNILKINFLLKKQKNIPLYEDFIQILQSNLILLSEIYHIEKEQKIYIVCCAMFVYISYFGKKYYLKIVKLK